MLEHRSDRIQAALLAAMLLAGAWVVASVPADARVAIHFNASGTPDGWATPIKAVFLMPLVAAGNWALMKLLPRIDPRGGNLQASARALASIGVALGGLFTALQAVIVGGALGWPAPGAHFFLLLIGAVFIVTGNVLGKLRPNYFVGIRTPWTLENDRVWDQTHRFGGKVFVGGGLLLWALAAAPLDAGWLGPLILAVTLGCAAITGLKSYLLWRRLKQQPV